jgi:tetratricopeptide (TPR) repeat protein
MVKQNHRWERYKKSMKESIRGMLKARSGFGKSVTGLLRISLERGRHLPGIGSSAARWAGFVHAMQGNHQQAVELYRIATRKGMSKSASLQYDMGMSLLKLHLPKEAEIHFRTAMQIDPIAIWPVTGLIQALQDQGLSHLAIPELLRVSKHLPLKQLHTLPFPGHMAQLLADKPEQIEQLAALVAKHPEAYYATLLLGQVETVRGNSASASSHFRAAGNMRFAGLQDPSAPVAKPKFFILGQAKAGTSALFQYLSNHPAMVAPMIKEPQFFSLYHHYGSEWYESLFPRFAPSSGLFTGEGSVTYLRNRRAPERIAGEIPDARLIVILRNPVSRAYSEYWMHRRLGRSLPSFEEAVGMELENWSACPVDEEDAGDGPRPFGYLSRSIALPAIRRWLKHFPPEQLLVLRNDQMASDLRGTLRRVCRFVGVPDFQPGRPDRHNEGRYPPLPDPLRQRLEAWFQPHQIALEEFLKTLPEYQA